MYSFILLNILQEEKELMNKRITYLLTTLLIAQSLSPVYAQTSYLQEGNYLALGDTYSRTTGPAIDVDRPTTTGPSIDINNPDVAVQVTADSVTTGGSLHISDFEKDYVSIKVNLKGTAFKNPREDGSSIASAMDQSLNIKPTNAEEHWKIISSIYINNETEFILNIKTQYLDMNSLSNTLSLTLPERLLITDKDVNVRIPIVHDVILPNGSAIVTSGSVLASDIIGGRIRVEVRLENTAFIDPKHAAGSVHSNILSTINLRALNGAEEIEGGSSLAVINEKEFVFELEAKNIDPNSIQDMLSFTVPGSLLTNRKNVVVQVPVIADSSTDNNNNGVGNDNTADNNNGAGNNNTADNNNNGVGNNNTADNSNNDAGNNSNTVDSKGGSEDNNSNTVDSKNSSEEDNASETTEVAKETPQETSGADVSTEVEKLPVTVSNSVEKLIQKQKRNLLTKTRETSYGLTINNQKIELENKLLVSNGRTLAPIRTISEALNIPIHYHDQSKTAIIQTEDTLIELPLGYNVAIVNGKSVPLDANDSSVMSTIKNNRSYLPMRFIAEQLNLNVDFDGEQISITSTK